MNYSNHTYLIRCLTNLHVGSGENNYGIIDKQIQRDTISSVPIIHSSGLKGAIREYFEEVVGLKSDKMTELFGSDKDTKDALQQGALRFFEASLISIPVRAKDSNLFYKSTFDSLINEFNNRMNVLGENVVKIDPKPSLNTVKAKTEFGELELYNEPLLGENIVKIEDSKMREVLKRLPVIARNSLENGQSENLWYEEVVPRESLFYFSIAVPSNLVKADFDHDFNANFHECIIQIGANATIGYGQCKITKIP